MNLLGRKLADRLMVWVLSALFVKPPAHLRPKVLEAL